MSLLYYETLFSNLNPNRSGGNTSPHKIAMLLAVMDLIGNGIILDNKIYYSEQLKKSFSEHFDRLKSERDRDNPFLPFFHLRSEGFWHHHLKPGQKESYDLLTTAGGSGVIEKHIANASLDDELFELLNNSFVRELLKTALYKNIEITPSQRQAILDVGNGWDWLECEACVQDYFSMLFMELSGTKYNKAEHRRQLLNKLHNRSEGSIEFKHQNISAVLLEMGYPYISGYKPAFNYQKQLKEVVLAHMASHQDEIDKLSAEDDSLLKQDSIDWEKVLDPELPEKLTRIEEPQRQYLARKINYSQQESSNKNLGADGENFVLNFEKYRLEKEGRIDLAKEVEWSSKEKGDGLGFDIRSFDSKYERELFIEVKTTKSGKYQPFYLSKNELSFSKEFSSQYCLYRVFDFKQQAKIFRLPGAIDKYVNLVPEKYKAVF